MAQHSQQGKATMPSDFSKNSEGTINIQSVSPEEVNPTAYQFLALFTTSDLDDTDYNRLAFIID